MVYEIITKELTLEMEKEFEEHMKEQERLLKEYEFYREMYKGLEEE